MFDAKDIDFSTIEADPADGMDEGTSAGRGFAVGGGVACRGGSHQASTGPGDSDRVRRRPAGVQKMLMMAKAGKRNGYLLEGMGCPGGCVAGAGTIRPVGNPPP